MPKKSWTKKDERKYEAILGSCKLDARREGEKKRTVADCKRIAAATVNRDRRGLGALGPGQIEKFRRDIAATEADWGAMAAKEWDTARQGRDRVLAQLATCSGTPDVRAPAVFYAHAMQAYSRAEMVAAMARGVPVDANPVSAQVRHELMAYVGDIANLCNLCRRGGRR